MTDSPEVLARVKEGMDLADILARQMKRQFGPHAHVDDLASAGREALLAAARSFDPERGVPFRRWANLRMRGAMIEHMRQQGSLPKRVYRKLRALQAAELVHEAAAEEPTPPTAEAADQKITDHLATAAMAMAVGFLSMRHGEAVDRARDPDHSPESTVGQMELIRIVQNAIEELPEQERTLLKRHYFDDVNMDVAAAEIGLSKSWACRLHARALESIAKAMKRGRIQT